MHPLLIVTVAAAGAAPIGWWLRRDLATLSYRTPKSVNCHHQAHDGG